MVLSWYVCTLYCVALPLPGETTWCWQNFPLKLIKRYQKQENSCHRKTALFSFLKLLDHESFNPWVCFLTVHFDDRIVKGRRTVISVSVHIIFVHIILCPFYYNFDLASITWKSWRYSLATWSSVKHTLIRACLKPLMCNFLYETIVLASTRNHIIPVSRKIQKSPLVLRNWSAAQLSKWDSTVSSTAR